MAEVFGATHTFADATTAHEFVALTTGGELVDHAIITVGMLHDERPRAVSRGVSTPRRELL